MHRLKSGGNLQGVACSSHTTRKDFTIPMELYRHIQSGVCDSGNGLEGWRAGRGRTIRVFIPTCLNVYGGVGGLNRKSTGCVR